MTPMNWTIRIAYSDKYTENNYQRTTNKKKTVFDTSKKVGVLGGGQLGLMLLQAAIDWNLNVKIIDAADAPCAPIAPEFVEGSLQDYEAVYRFGQDVDVLTIEIEKVNVDALEALEREGKKVFPQPHLIRLIQDKRTQKQFYREHGLPTADFILTDNRADVANYVDFLPILEKLLMPLGCWKKLWILRKNWP